MNKSVEIRRSISIGLIVAVFLFNTGRVSKAIEGLYILNNKAIIKEEDVLEAYCNIIYVIIFKAHCLNNDNTNAIKYGRKLLVMYAKSGKKGLEAKLSLRLSKLYHFQSKYFDATKV